MLSVLSIIKDSFDTAFGKQFPPLCFTVPANRLSSILDKSVKMKIRRFFWAVIVIPSIFQAASVEAGNVPKDGRELLNGSPVLIESVVKEFVRVGAAGHGGVEQHQFIVEGSPELFSGSVKGVDLSVSSDVPDSSKDSDSDRNYSATNDIPQSYFIHAWWFPLVVAGQTFFWFVMYCSIARSRDFRP